MASTLNTERSKVAEGPSCSLSAEKLERRLGDWRQLRAEALISETVEEDVVTATYRRSPDVERRLRELVEAERSCCPFLGLTVVEEPEALRLEVRGASGAPALFDAGDRAARR